MAQGTDCSVRRVADVLLWHANGRTVMLRMPAAAVADSAAEQLGLSTPEFQDVPLEPVAFRKSRAKIDEGKPMQAELFVSATAVKALLGDVGFASAGAMFAAAFGVLVDQVLMTIVSASEIEAGGTACGYRLLLREPIALEV
jgi:hypothetical protein